MMNSKTQIVIHSDIKKSGQAIALKANEAVRIKVESGKKYILNSDGDVGPENVTVTRAGNDLLIALEGSEQPSVVLEDYFAQTQTPGVYGIAEDGRLYEYTRTDGVPGIFSIEDGATEPVALGGDALGEGAPYLVEGDDGNSFFFFLPWLLGGLGLAALGGALYAANRDDDEPAQVAAPVVTGASDNVGPEQGALANGDTTDDSTPTLTGTGTPGSIVTIYDDGKAIGSTTVDGNGSWTVTPSDPLTDGKHDLTAVTTDPDGNVSPPSPPFVVDVDTGTTPPPAPVRASRFPQVNWVVSKTSQKDALGRSQPWATGLSLQWNAFQGGAAKAAESAALERASANEERAQVATRNLEYQLRTSAEQRDSAMRRAAEYSELIGETDRVRKAFYEQWFHLGKRTLLDVLIAESEHYNTEIAQVNSRFDSQGANLRIRADSAKLLNWLLGDTAIASR